MLYGCKLVWDCKWFLCFVGDKLCDTLVDFTEKLYNFNTVTAIMGNVGRGIARDRCSCASAPESIEGLEAREIPLKRSGLSFCFGFVVLVGRGGGGLFPSSSRPVFLS